MSRPFSPRHSFFVGVDSDGCAFDTMEVKHKECFIPAIIEYFGLAPVSKVARECAEFVNLYSQQRGINRFPGLIAALDLLARRPESIGRGFVPPELPVVRKWLETETKLGNPALAAAVESSKDRELANLLEWSKAVNRAVERVVKAVPPFPLVRESLAALGGKSDCFVCSATPGEALEREWEEHGLSGLVARICGQEVGTKKEILRIAKDYPPGHCLMLGDAPGDLQAARANNVLFFPINPGAEEASWKRFYEEGLDRFFRGSYAGEYEASLVAEFDARIPASPPWKT